MFYFAVLVMTIKERIVTTISYLRRPRKRKLIKIASKLKGKVGLEIGGPSPSFSMRSYFPVYLFAKRIDGVNFSSSTIWEGVISEGENFAYYNNKKGFQYIAEAANLLKIESNKYDFLLSCHSLEHTANTLKALKEWNRVLRNDGYLILVLPDKKFTFDEYRSVTTFEHLREDLENDTEETDDTHFEEIIKLHNIERDTGIKTKHELIERTNNNYENRCVHHHVFDFELIKTMLLYTGFSVKLQQWIAPFNMVTIAKKIADR
jgi:predicted SAM-dependent methyltransferase